MNSPRKTLIDATSTPLASIFGSGFLVIVPILNGVAGPYSIIAMLAVLALAYAVGSVVRFNIRHAEPLLESRTAPRLATTAEDVSDFALVLAYIISVCLYLRILASYLLTGLGRDTELNERILTTAVIVVIAAVALTKGLQMLERLEEVGLWVTLGIMALVLATFAVHDVRLVSGGGLDLGAAPTGSWWGMLTVLGGTLITVQGFETSRYLEEEFEADTRIRSCRLSQLIAGGVYLALVALATPLLPILQGEVSDNGLIVLATAAAAWLAVPLVAAAVFSQFSAAVADTVGGEGNMVEASHGRVSSRVAYAVILVGAVLLCWTASTLQILAIASRAFAFYYMLQCFVAMSISDKPLQKLGMALVALVLAFIAVFAVPAG